MIMMIEMTKKAKKASEKIEEAMELIEDAAMCVKELAESEDYSECRGSMRMRSRYGKPSYRHDEYDDEDSPKYRMY